MLISPVRVGVFLGSLRFSEPVSCPNYKQSLGLAAMFLDRSTSDPPWELPAAFMWTISRCFLVDLSRAAFYGSGWGGGLSQSPPRVALWAQGANENGA